jgi:hypothetical protein
LFERTCVHGGDDRRVGAAKLPQHDVGVVDRRVDRIRCAERCRHVELVGAHVDGGDSGAGNARVLHRHVAQSADSEHGDQIGRPDIGHLYRFVGRHAGAGERGSVERVDAVGHWHHILRRSQHVLGIAAVSAVTGVLLMRAQRLPSAHAVLAFAASPAEPWDRHPASGSRVRDTFAEGDNDAHTFVAGHERQAGLHRPVAMGGVDVGVAEPAGFDTDGDLSGARRRNFAINDLERTIERRDNSCAHGGSSRGVCD